MKKRIIICKFFSQYCESIIDTLQNKNIIKSFDNISQSLLTTYELINSQWIKGNDKNSKQNSKVTSMFSNLYAIAYNFTSSNKEGKNNENNNNNKDDIEDKETYIFNSLNMICSLISENDLGNNLENVTNMFRINLEKGKNKQNELLCKSFYTFLEFNIEKIKGRLSNLFQLITNKNISLNNKFMKKFFI